MIYNLALFSAVEFFLLSLFVCKSLNGFLLIADNLPSIIVDVNNYVSEKMAITNLSNRRELDPDLKSHQLAPIDTQTLRPLYHMKVLLVSDNVFC